MRRLIMSTIIALAFAGTSLTLGASKQAAGEKDPKIGTRVTITGCLHQGTSKDSFILMGVTERPAGSPPASIRPVPLAIYWLDSTKGLKDRVGDMVDITGKVTERRPQPGMVTVAIDVSETASTDVRVTSATKTLDVTTKKYDDRPRPSGASDSDSSITVTRPVYKLDVETVGPAANFPAGAPVCR